MRLVFLFCPVLVSIAIAVESRGRELAEPHEPAAPVARPAAAETAVADPAGLSVGNTARVATNLTAAQIADRTDGLLELQERVKRCLAYYYHRPEPSSWVCPWEVMHCIVGFGVDTPLRAESGRCNAVAWTCENLPCGGLRMLYVENGRLGVRKGPGYQGHEGQLLSILAQARVKIDYPLHVDGYKFTVADLVEHEQRGCLSSSELSFKLIGLSHYRDTEASWQSEDGEKWDIPRLIQEELAQPVVGACCGGTHRLMGYTFAVRNREKSGQPMTGQWRRAKRYVDDFHEYTFALQNPDGSFSSEWFRGPGDWGGADRKVNTSGHILEWLVLSLPREELTDPRVIKAVDLLTRLLWDNRRRDWSIGHLGHALHALAMYDEYLFEGKPGCRAAQLAQYRVDEPLVRVDRSDPIAASAEWPSYDSPSMRLETPRSMRIGGLRRWRTR